MDKEKLDTEKALAVIAESANTQTLSSLCEYLRDKWVYFYIIDDGSFAGGFGGGIGVKEIVNTSKKRPVNIPTVNENGLHNAVLYIHEDTAIKCIQPEYRVGQMKGDKAYDMLLGIKSITGMIIQGHDAWVSFPISYLEELQSVEA